MRRRTSLASAFLGATLLTATFPTPAQAAPTPTTPPNINPTQTKPTPTALHDPKPAVSAPQKGEAETAESANGPGQGADGRKTAANAPQKGEAERTGRERGAGLPGQGVGGPKVAKKTPVEDGIAGGERAVLGVGFGVGAGRVRQGDGVLYTARVRNSGAVRAEGVKVVVELPRGVGLLGASDEACVERGGGLVCTVGRLGVGESWDVVIEGMVKGGAEGVLVGRAQAVAGNAEGAGAEARISVKAGTDLAVRLQAPKRALAGERFVMVARVANRGAVAARKVRLAVGTERARIVALDGSCRSRGDEGRCELGRLNPGESVELRIGVIVDSDTRGVIGNFAATASTELGDTAPENNTAVALVEVVRPAEPLGEMLPATGADPKPLTALAFLLLGAGALLRRLGRTHGGLI
ncbi:hypothetical protein GCM10027589_20550 [Actinocorallia lasiicapitis]